MDKKVGILVFLLVVLGLVGAFVLVQQEQETRRGAAGETASLMILPSEDNVSSGESISAQLILSVGSNKVSAVDVQLKYDPTKLNVISVTRNESLFPNRLRKEIDTENGLVKLGVAQFDFDNLATGDGLKIADLTIKVNQTGTIDFDSSYTHEVVGINSAEEDVQYELSLAGATYRVGSAATATEAPKATATETPTSTPPAEGENTLTFLVSFLGVEDSSAVKYSPVVDVVIKQGYQTTQEVKNVTLQSAGGAKFSGTIALDQTGSNYSVYIKSRRHLSRKFCTDGQTSHCVGQGSIVLTEGDNKYDFSGLAMEPGDLDHPKQGQDDIIDSLDFSLAKAELQNTSGKSPADIDYNGTVNGRDLVLILSSLSTKHGELD